MSFTRYEEDAEAPAKSERNLLSLIETTAVWHAVYVWRDAGGMVQLTALPVIGWGLYETVSYDGNGLPIDRQRACIGLTAVDTEILPADHARNFVGYTTVEPRALGQKYADKAIAKLEEVERVYGRQIYDGATRVVSGE